MCVEYIGKYVYSGKVFLPFGHTIFIPSRAHFCSYIFYMYFGCCIMHVFLFLLLTLMYIITSWNVKSFKSFWKSYDRWILCGRRRKKGGVSLFKCRPAKRWRTKSVCSAFACLYLCMFDAKKNPFFESLHFSSYRAVVANMLLVIGIVCFL